ncbi:hypothetical protein [Oscillatoria salina]|nr:hypothetical protein [Oscillatoria salina]MBZ8182724.1 hypothetical protein [Oscillatoria salina IIICB1]
MYQFSLITDDIFPILPGEVIVFVAIATTNLLKCLIIYVLSALAVAIIGN